MSYNCFTSTKIKKPLSLSILKVSKDNGCQDNLDLRLFNFASITTTFSYLLKKQ